MGVMKSKHLKIILTVVVVLLIALGTFLYLHLHKTTQSHIYMPANMTLTQKAIYLSEHNQYAEAQQVWQQQLTSTSNTQTKLGILYQLSALALEYNHYSVALKYANEADRLSPNSPAPFVAYAQLATQQRNYAAAKQYWQDAIDRLNPNTSYYNITKYEYQSAMDSLQ